MTRMMCFVSVIGWMVACQVTPAEEEVEQQVTKWDASIPPPLVCPPLPPPCPSQCANGVATVQQWDPAMVACGPWFRFPCEPYACASNGMCKAACETNSDCSPGASCDTTRGTCSTGVTRCQGAFAVEMPNGVSQSCAPYKCVGGRCNEHCDVNGDCAPGYGCVSRACVAL